MSGEKEHIIQSQTLDFSFPKGREDMEQNSKVSKFFYQTILPVIEKVFDENITGDNILRIDKLNLDLGEIDLKKINSDIPIRLESELKSQLKNLVENHENKGNVEYIQLDNVNYKLEILESLLTNGNLPWFVKNTRDFNTNKLIKDLLQKDESELAELLIKIQKNTNSVKRIIRYFNNEQQKRISEVLYKMLSTELKAVVDSIVKLYESLNIDLKEIRRFENTRLALILFSHELVRNLQPHNIQVRLLFENIFNKKDVHGYISEKVINLFPKNFLKSISAIQVVKPESSIHPSKSDVTLAKFKTKLLKELKKRGILAGQVIDYLYFTTIKVQIDGISKNQPDPEIQSDLSATANDEILSIDTRTLKGEKDIDLSSDSRKNKKNDPLFIDEINENRKKISDKKNITLKGESNIEDKESEQQAIVNKLENTSFNDTLKELFAENAGIVILQPFIPQLFKLCDITNEKGEFISNSEKHKAIYLLNYLVFGDNYFMPEYQLSLNKILCEIDFSEALDTNIRISDSEKKYANDLLKSVIKHWKVLKNTSVEGLRETFLQRQGKVEIKKDKVILVVEKKSFDILIEKLPWAISVVKFQWNKKIIHVQW